MIPKIIHYTWFSGEPLPPFLKNCMETWRKVMPDYEIREWGPDSFDFNSVAFVKEAFEHKKWAFMADYVRCYAIYKYGGFYLDTDVRVFKPFDDFLHYDFVTSHEVSFKTEEAQKRAEALCDETGKPLDPSMFIDGIGIQGAIMGGAKGCIFMKKMMDYYNSIHFVELDGSIDLKKFVIGRLLSKNAEKYGYRYKDNDMMLDENMRIYKSSVFASSELYVNEQSVCVHLHNGSWRHERTKTLKFKLRNHYPVLYWLCVKTKNILKF